MCRVTEPGNAKGIVETLYAVGVWGDSNRIRYVVVGTEECRIWTCWKAIAQYRPRGIQCALSSQRDRLRLGSTRSDNPTRIAVGNLLLSMRGCGELN